MANNFSNTYQRVWEWEGADKSSGRIVDGTSTKNNDIGVDVDEQVLRGREMTTGDVFRGYESRDDMHSEIQTLDYDRLNQAQGNNSTSIDASWAQRLSGGNNFLTQDGANTSVDQGGFMDVTGGDRTRTDIMGGTWDQKEMMDINEKNNGRMHDIGKTVPINFRITDEGGFARDNQHTSIKGLIEHNSLNDIFFSDMNQKGIQDTLAFRVHENTNEYIGTQSENELFIVMRSILLQYGNFRVSSEKLVEEIHKLNEKVLRYCVETVSSNVLQHKGYQKDLESLPTPLNRPQNPYLDKGYAFDLSARNEM